MCEMWKMCNFMFTFCAYLAEGSLVAGIGTGSGLRAKPRPSTWVAFASYFLCAMRVCVCTIFWLYSWVNLTNCRMAQAKSDQASKRAATTTTSTKTQPTFWDTFEHMSNVCVCVYVFCVCKEGNTAEWYVWTNDY